MYRFSKSGLCDRSLRLEPLEDRRLLAVMQPLGDLPGGSFGSFALGVSANGTTIVGRSSSANGTEAFRWTEDGRMQGLGDLPGGSFHSEARAVSADGTTIVGTGNSAEGDEAFRWTADGGMLPLSALPGGGPSKQASGVSADGTAIVGTRSTDDGSEAFRWTADGGMQGLGVLPGESFHSEAAAISADGTTIVGVSSFANGFEAFRWTAADKMQPLGDLPGGAFDSTALAVSADGTTIVGYSSSANGSEAFRWTLIDGMQPLGDLPGGTFASFATGVSADGTTIVGYSSSSNGYEAFRWTAADKMQPLGDLPGGFFDSQASGVAASGSTIVGYSSSNNGYEAFRWTADTQLVEFSHKEGDERQLSVTFRGPLDFELGFFDSNVGELDGMDSPIGGNTNPYRIDVTLDSISNDPALSLQDNGDGTKSLFIDPSHTPLQAALEDQDLETLIVGAFELGGGENALSEAAFRGFYRESGNPLAVLRTGPDSVDTISVGERLIFTGKTSGTVPGTTLSGIDSLLVVTGDLNDTIQMLDDIEFNLIVKAGGGNDEISSGKGDDHLDGGAGNDKYFFTQYSAGTDEILDSNGEELLNFRLFPNAIRLDLTRTTSQDLNDDLSLKLPSATSIENVTGSQKSDHIRGNTVSNELFGLSGEDILVGGPGDAKDTLDGGNDDDVLIGDDFNLTYDAWTGAFSSFANLLNTDLLGFEVDLTPVSGGDDTILGGGGNDVIIGGDGADTIEAGEGQSLVFGDAFEVKTSFSFNLSGAWTDLTTIEPMFTGSVGFSLRGNGNDVITAGTENSLIVGGDGDDTITGGAGTLDVLLGNDGEDTIDGKDGGVNLIFGGDGADKELRGGDSLNVIFGDGLKFLAGATFDPAALSVSNLKPISTFLASVEQSGSSSDGDKIVGGSGPNIVIGGPGRDVIDGGDSDDSLDLLFGNDDNDMIHGHAGPNIIVGGANSLDPQTGPPSPQEFLEGGDDFDLILGDDFTLTGAGDVDIAALISGEQKWPSLLAIGVKLTGIGNDSIRAGNGVNIVFAGDGNDFVTGGSGPIEFLFGNEGIDTIYGFDGLDVILGGDGDDERLDGGSGNNLIFGDSIQFSGGLSIDLDSIFASTPIFSASIGFKLEGSGRDYIYGGPDADFMVGGDGRDVFYAGDGVNIAFGDGFDFGGLGLVYSFGKYVLKTGNPVVAASFTAAELVVDETKELIQSLYDWFVGSEGDANDQGSDTYYGGNDHDIVFGGRGPDGIFGYGGTDFLLGGGGSDEIYDGTHNVPGGTEWGIGGLGNDSITGSDGPDVLFSDVGDDRFFGLSGDDVIFGGPEADFLSGGPGADLLAGEDGDDWMYGGPGVDLIEAIGGSDIVVPDSNPLPGDYDYNGKVDGADFLEWQRGIGTTGAELEADGNEDNVVDSADLTIWQEEYGSTLSLNGNSGTDNADASSPVLEPISSASWISAPSTTIPVPSNSVRYSGIGNVRSELNTESAKSPVQSADSRRSFAQPRRNELVEVPPRPELDQGDIKVVQGIDRVFEELDEGIDFEGVGSLYSRMC